LVLGFFEALSMFGGGQALGISQLPQIIRPLYYRMRMNDVATAATLPAKTEAASDATSSAIPESQSYTVIAGDSLWKIAKDSYGNGQRWIDIWRLNRAKIAEADLIFPGQTLAIPGVELHRESGARPGVSLKDITPKTQATKDTKAPQTLTTAEETDAGKSAGTVTQAAPTGAVSKDTQALKNNIQPKIDALAKSLDQLKISVDQYAKAEKAKKVSADDLKHIASYAAEAKKLTTAVASASSKTAAIDAVANLLDVARDTTATVNQMVQVGQSATTASSYPGGVYQTSTGAPMTLTPSTPAPSIPTPQTTTQGPTVTPAGTQLETLPPGYAWKLYPNDPTAQPDVAYPTGSAPYSIPAGYQVTHQYQTTPTQDIVGPMGDSWIFNTETGALNPNRTASVSSATVAAPVAVVTPAAVVVAPLVVATVQAAVLSQTVGERVATAGISTTITSDAIATTAATTDATTATASTAATTINAAAAIGGVASAVGSSVLGNSGNVATVVAGSPSTTTGGITAIAFNGPSGPITIDQSTQVITSIGSPTGTGGVIDVVTITPLDIAGTARSYARLAQGLVDANTDVPGVAALAQDVNRAAEAAATAAKSGDMLGTTLATGEAQLALGKVREALSIPSDLSVAPTETIEVTVNNSPDSLSSLASQYPNISMGLGVIGLGIGAYNLSQDNVSGIPSIVSGAGALVSGIGATIGSAAVGGLSGAGAAALAGGGAAGATAATGGVAAGMAAAGAGLSVVGGVAALGPVFHSLFGRGGIFSTAKNLPTAQFYSFAAGRQGIANLGNAIGGASSLDALTNVLNTSFAPHGEVQMGSVMDKFGWAGDWDDPASPKWLQALADLRDPTKVLSGLPWVDEFVRGLWVQGPGQTGDVPFNPKLTVELQTKITNALPDHPSYASLKQDLGTGGTRDQLISLLRAASPGVEVRSLLDQILPLVAQRDVSPGAPIGYGGYTQKWLNGLVSTPPDQDRHILIITNPGTANWQATIGPDPAIQAERDYQANIKASYGEPSSP